MQIVCISLLPSGLHFPNEGAANDQWGWIFTCENQHQSAISELNYSYTSIFMFSRGLTIGSYHLCLFSAEPQLTHADVWPMLIFSCLKVTFIAPRSRLLLAARSLFAEQGAVTVVTDTLHRAADGQSLRSVS